MTPLALDFGFASLGAEDNTFLMFYATYLWYLVTATPEDQTNNVPILELQQ